MTASIPPFTRRSFLATAGVGAGALALAACGGPTTTSQDAGGSNSSGGSASAAPDLDFAGVTPAKEISFWTNHPGKSQDTETALAKSFTEKTGIKVNIVTAGANYEEVAQKFQTAQTGSDIPSVILLSDVWWFRYFLNDAIIPLEGLFKQLNVETGDYRQTLLDDYLYNGKHWAVPFCRSTPVFYYNRDIWAKAGLEDRAPKTWQELEEWVPKIQPNLGDAKFVYMNPSPDNYDSWYAQNKIWGWGGNYSNKWDITCDSPDTIAALKWSQDAVKNKWAGISGKDVSADFSAGAAACILESTGSLVGILKAAKFKVGVGFLPGGPKATDKVCPTGGAGMAIPKKLSKEVQLAAGMFIQHMTTPENAATFSKATGYLPVRTSADMSDVIKERPQAQVAIDQLAHTRSQDWGRVFLPGADRKIGEAIAAITAQNADVTQQMQQLKKDLEKIYNADVKPNLH